VTGAAVAAMALVALAVFAGWLRDGPAWRGEVAGSPPMAPVSALTFLVAAAALAHLAPGSPATWRRRAGTALALLVLASGLYHEALIVLGGDPALDRLFPAAGVAPLNGTYAVRMSAGSAVLFALSGLGLLGLAGRRPAWLSPLAALAVAVVSWTVIVSFAYGARDTSAAAKPMSLAAAALFQALAAGVLCARTDREPIAILSRPGPGGVLARRLLPFALLTLPILGGVRMAGESLGVYGHHFGIALFVVVATALVCAIVWQTATGLERMDGAVRAHRGQLQAIFDNASYVMFLKDRDGRYLIVNREFERATGMTREQAVGRTVFDLLPPEVAEPIWARERQALLTDGPSTFEAVSSPLNDGPHTWLISTTPLRDESGAVSGLCGIVSDITERRRAEDELRRAKESAESANGELEAFAYSVSHDLRAPLRHIAGFVELLEAHALPALDDTARGHLSRIAAAARRMSVLIDDLLSFSRMGRAGMRRDPVDLGNLAEEVRREALHGVASGRRIVWVIDRLPVVRGDRAMLRVVLTNLFSNAVKYSAPRPEARIEVSARQADGETVVCVRDNGVGFDPRFASKLFGVFQRLHRSDEFEGTGIGLASVRRIITRHGGRTWAESAPDRGAAFSFSLPDRSPGGEAHEEQAA
jgi:PAS domain S-box-containing protein